MENEMAKDVDKKIMMENFRQLPEGMQEYLRKQIAEPDRVEEFVSAIIVGDCPVCGSSKTRDCGDTPLDDIYVGICLKCSTIWCLECGLIFEKGQHTCPHRAICDKCDFIDEDKEECAQIESLDYSIGNCSIIQEMKSRLNQYDKSEGEPKSKQAKPKTFAEIYKKGTFFLTMRAARPRLKPIHQKGKGDNNNTQRRNSKNK